jgi:thiol peroxidase
VWYTFGKKRFFFAKTVNFAQSNLLILPKHFKPLTNMAKIKLGESTVNTSGELPAAGSTAPDFQLVATDMKGVSLSTYKGKNIILNIFPSIDTRVCATSVRAFNLLASKMNNTVVLSVSKDLPYAHKRFCAAEGIDNVVMLSDFLNEGFSNDYGVLMTDGGMRGLHARAIVVIDPQGKVKYSEMVPSIGEEPNYDAALQAVK